MGSASRSKYLLFAGYIARGKVERIDFYTKLNIGFVSGLKISATLTVVRYLSSYASKAKLQYIYGLLRVPIAIGAVK